MIKSVAMIVEHVYGGVIVGVRKYIEVFAA